MLRLCANGLSPTGGAGEFSKTIFALSIAIIARLCLSCPDRMDAENHYVRVANMPRTHDPGDGLLADLRGTTIALLAITATPAATVAPARAYEQIPYTWYGDDHRS